MNSKKIDQAVVNAADLGLEPRLLDNDSQVSFAICVRSYLQNWRQGTVGCKDRSEVAFANRKPWKQKGTGRARAGSARSPLWKGGGVTFGPKPRDYSQSMNKKARQAALKSSLVARQDELVVVQNFDGLFKSAPKADTKVTEQP